MTAGGNQVQPGTPAAAANVGSDQAPPVQQSPAAEQRVHLYEAVSARRDQVLSQFAGQRAAILKAVADQRAAALAPVLAVQAKRANEPAAASANPAPATSSGTAPSPAGNVAIGAELRRQTLIQLRRAAAADIVAVIRSLVAAEVRAQLAAMEPVACGGQTAASTSDAAQGKATRAME
ncbi:MAG TPA: hypothetical protein VEK75_05335 [Xanthobacteraceae bacterium]|nr:hypothetical protein [Xanthobacteraceae bacterium]